MNSFHMNHYRGRIAPTPTGFLHLGHGQTFWIAYRRAREAGGQLVYRTEDLDAQRCSDYFATAAIEDLAWLGIEWAEGPDRGGAFGPYIQSRRLKRYRQLLNHLISRGFAYPCRCSRRDVREAASAPHEEGDEPLYAGTCRPSLGQTAVFEVAGERRNVNWRFRVPFDDVVAFEDGRYGSRSFNSGKDFGDFVLWRHDGMPSYQLAVVADDHDMDITEVVRGADLLKCTARQLLLYNALGWPPPAYYHCPLVTDDSGRRLAKRDRSRSLRSMRQSGVKPKDIRSRFIE